MRGMRSLLRASRPKGPTDDDDDDDGDDGGGAGGGGDDGLSVLNLSERNASLSVDEDKR